MTAGLNIVENAQEEQKMGDDFNEDPGLVFRPLCRIN